jgi:hypothetical protein
MSKLHPQHPAGNLVVAAGWSAVVLAAVAVVGLVVAPSLRMVWIVLLVLAVAAMPQAVVLVRRERRKTSEANGEAGVRARQDRRRR